MEKVNPVNLSSFRISSATNKANSFQLEINENGLEKVKEFCPWERKAENQFILD